MCACTTWWFRSKVRSPSNGRLMSISSQGSARHPSTTRANTTYSVLRSECFRTSTIILVMITSNTLPTQPHSFEDRLESSQLPPPGPSHYEARRALWLKPNGHRREPLPPSTSRHKLETLLNAPNAVNNNDVWKGGVEKVWKGLSTGVTLKKRLPMAMVVSV